MNLEIDKDGKVTATVTMDAGAWLVLNELLEALRQGQKVKAITAPARAGAVEPPLAYLGTWEQWRDIRRVLGDSLVSTVSSGDGPDAAADAGKTGMVPSPLGEGESLLDAVTAAAVRLADMDGLSEGKRLALIRTLMIEANNVSSEDSPS